MSNDTYSAPCHPDRLEFLKGRLESQRERFGRFFNGPLDSIELHGLADELVWLAESFRTAADKSIDEHIAGRRLRVVTAKPISERIHHQDGNVEGRYIYWTVTDDEALDAFHESEPVKVLEDFEFTVSCPSDEAAKPPTNRGDI